MSGLLGKVLNLAILVLPIILATTVVYSANSPNSGYGSLQIRITYSGQWNGFYDSGDSTRQINGTGSTSIQIYRPESKAEWTVIASAQKNDTTANTLTITLVADGRILDSDLTSGPDARALVSFTSGPLWCSRPIPYYC